ncbi:MULTISPECIES: S24 family peptidase [unclassified Novosphingobium]|uniref:XRE family transcriptional regulator n=1 Tax=unclassified Novosphingobium TaxID=2644732 RepID=UPI000D2FF72E|nr:MULTISPECIES: S24 family peptidase [unclassified Novosphingobium]
MVEALTKVAGACNNKSCVADFYQSCNARTVFRSDRLLALMAQENLSQSALARRVGVSSTAIWKLLNDPAQGSKHTHKIARELGTSPEYLMGETDDPKASGEIRFVPAVQEAPAEAPSDPDHVEIDLIDFAYGMGGTFTDTDHIDVEKVGFSRRWLRQFTHSAPNQLFTTKGIGDSMAPTISDHDIVVVDKSDRVPEFADKVWAIVYGGMAMIKRLRQLPDGSMLISSDNQLVRDARATDGELHVVGRVVAVVRKL